MLCPRRLTVLALLVAGPAAPAQKEFGFDNRKPSGQEYLKPEETVRRMKVADGFEVKLFAGEPDVVNPIAFTIDEKGRVWVVECFEYPKRTPRGKMPRDRIVILEDTDGDGKADKRTVFAEGKDFPASFDMASGIEVGHGGVFLGAPPYLWFLKDEDGDGKADKFEVLLKGFGSHDTHETLNTFQWGPDGRLYGLHGVFTQSEIDGVKMNAAVWRYDVKAKKFEVFAEGTSNPWGMDYRNSDGQFIVCCCVIPHLFHVSPGGTYKRQAGTSFNPYAYGLLNEICDHTFHKESGWAHAGLLSLDSPHFPKEYHDSVIFGSIHGCSVKRNVLKKNGSTYTASRADDFLVSGDKNFRPINLKWGPDGDVYLIDWHDQNPCHQTNPDDWDYERGRVYRIERMGAKRSPRIDWGKLGNLDLGRVAATDDNPFNRRAALRLLHEWKHERQGGGFAGEQLPVAQAWALYANKVLEDREIALGLLRDNARPEDAVTRSWLIRLAEDRADLSETLLKHLTALAGTEKAPEVRLQLASTARRLGSRHDLLPLLHELMRHKEDTADPVIPLMLWLAYEPKLAAAASTELGWLQANAAGNPLITDHIIDRALRRLAATGKAEDLAACVAFLGDVKTGPVRRQALLGLTQGMQNRQIDAPAGWKAVREALLSDGDGDVQRLTRRLSVNFRDAEALRRALAVARDATKSVAERAEAVRDLGVAYPAEAYQPLVDLVRGDSARELRAEAARALSGYDRPEVARDVLAGWAKYPPALRVETVNLLAGRKNWAAELLKAVGDKRVPRTDLTDNTVLRLRAFKDKALNDQIESVWGKVREKPPEELAALIDKMRGELGKGGASFARGKVVFENNCAKCHQFEGKGHEVGPNLDGAARDVEYLLANVLDPNRVIGKPYYTRFLSLKNGRVESGLLVAEDGQSVTLKGENAAQKVIQKNDIDEMTEQEKSLMPEGLANNLTAQDFRDLVRYAMAHPFLTDVQVAGPFAPAEGVEAPALKGVTWSPLSVGPTGRIPLPAGKDNAEVKAFARAEVTAPGAVRTELLLGAGQPVRAWLNGKLVYQGKPGGTAAPDLANAAVELREGSNELVFEVTYKGDKEALYARLLDPQRRLKYPEGKQ